MSVAPSPENGNVSVETEPTVTPAEQTTPEAPTETVETAPPAEPTAELFELPDGRKVDAQTLTKEWKENFLPDYTRKSQALAAKAPTDINKPTNPLEDPNYTPATYAELAAKIKEDTLREIEGRETARIEQQKALETVIENQLTEIKKSDSAFNESALFQHATKYGFRDLKLAHQNMKDMAAMAKKVQQTTAANVAKRTDPVSGSPGATGTRPDPSQFSTSQAYLQALKASGK